MRARALSLSYSRGRRLVLAVFSVRNFRPVLHADSYTYAARLRNVPLRPFVPTLLLPKAVVDGATYYLTAWKGYESCTGVESQSTWQPEHLLYAHANDKLLEYWHTQA